jgi:hypothetical protein
MDVAPSIDHIAFITSDLLEVERQLQLHNVLYKRVSHSSFAFCIFRFCCFIVSNNISKVSFIGALEEGKATGNF